MEGYSISGWKCISDIQVIFVIKLDISWGDFLSLVIEFKEELKGIIGDEYSI